MLVSNRQNILTFYSVKKSQMGAILCIQEPRNGTLLIYCFLRDVYIIIKVGATLKQTKRLIFYSAKNSQMGAILCIQEPRKETLLLYCF